MKYFHCPKVYKGRSYGCGYGPVDMTAAMLDSAGKCPKCQQTLLAVRGTARKRMAAAQEHLEAAAATTQLFGAAAGAEYLHSHRPRK